MRKAKSLEGKNKPAKQPKRREVVWSLEKAASLRKPASMPSGGDCACNCGGK